MSNQPPEDRPYEFEDAAQLSHAQKLANSDWKRLGDRSWVGAMGEGIEAALSEIPGAIEGSSALHVQDPRLDVKEPGDLFQAGPRIRVSLRVGSQAHAIELDLDFDAMRAFCASTLDAPGPSLADTDDLLPFERGFVAGWIETILSAAVQDDSILLTFLPVQCVSVSVVVPGTLSPEIATPSLRRGLRGNLRVGPLVLPFQCRFDAAVMQDLIASTERRTQSDRKPMAAQESSEVFVAIGKVTLAPHQFSALEAGSLVPLHCKPGDELRLLDGRREVARGVLVFADGELSLQVRQLGPDASALDSGD